MDSHQDIEYLKIVVAITERAFNDMPDMFRDQLYQLRAELEALQKKKKK